MILIKMFSIWIAMGFVSWVFVYLFTIISLWFMKWRDYKEGINTAYRLLDSLSNLSSFILWLIRGPFMLMLVIKSIIDVIIN